MLLGFLTVVIMLVVAYAYWREGLLTACTMFVNVILAGLVAFNFWEPLADLLDPMVANTALQGYEDAICLILLFCLTLGLLRLVTNNIANTDLEFPPALLRGGGVFFGLATGYLTSGFLICVFQTLPWHESFMHFDWKYDPQAPGHVVRSVMPPDRAWLGLMQRAGAFAFINSFTYPDEKAKDPQTFVDRAVTFDKHSTFESRYARLRRYTDKGDPPPDTGEYDELINRRRENR